jgi:hypothetical protein
VPLLLLCCWGAVLCLTLLFCADLLTLLLLPGVVVLPPAAEYTLHVPLGNIRITSNTRGGTDGELSSTAAAVAAVRTANAAKRHMEPARLDKQSYTVTYVDTDAIKAR